MTRSYIVDSLNLMISAALSKNYVMTTEVDLVIVISNNGTLNKTRIHEIMHSYLFPHKQAYPKSVLFISQGVQFNVGGWREEICRSYPQTTFEHVNLDGRPVGSISELGKALVELGLAADAVTPIQPRKNLIYNTPGT
jgi:hypothetical protein